MDIISLLKNNPNINLYLNKIDYLSFEELSNIFSYVLNNIMSFASNPQSFLLINKIISLYNPNLSSQNEEKDNNINEYIYSFLLSFFKKKISFLIHSNNNNSNYISSIIYLIIKFGYPKNDCIFIEIEQDFKIYAYNKQGSFLIQNIFPLGNEIQQQNLLNIILEQCDELINDKYGHYLFKYLLYQAENGENYYYLILSKIYNNLKNYSKKQYSSVIIERLLDSSNVNIINKINEKICIQENDIIELLYNKYGNYILQKIIYIIKDNNILGIIYKAIMSHKNTLNKLPYGKKIVKEIIAAYTLK